MKKVNSYKRKLGYEIIEYRNQWCYWYAHGRYYRGFKHIQEKKFYEQHKYQEDDVCVKIRVKRSVNNLQDPWNDHMRSREQGKSWKDFSKRRKQWER